PPPISSPPTPSARSARSPEDTPMQAMYIAASGMLAQETNVEVISNNIANMRTTGYKRGRAAFQDLPYPNARQPG
ncbi:hypothetical protein KC217_23650, partial [Mycobacterium tuberculosis]|nr:hypothetical protein [Mycobacterium tuberculosis]